MRGPSRFAAVLLALRWLPESPHVHVTKEAFWSAGNPAHLLCCTCVRQIKSRAGTKAAAQAQSIAWACKLCL